MSYRVYADTEKSFEPEHLVNEDSYFFSEFSFMQDKKIKLLLIADGMGGLENGDQASQDAIDGFMEVFYLQLMRNYLKPDMESYSLSYAVRDIKNVMIQAIQNANHSVCQNADPYKATGSTITAICIIDDCMVVANVGDSPVYLYRKNQKKLRVVSELQTKAEQDVKSGAYKRYSEEYYKNDHILTCSLGQYSKLLEEDIHIKAYGRLEKGDIILTGSDGCFGHTKSKVIQTMLEDCGVEEEGFVLTQLFEMARVDRYDDQTGIMFVAG